MITDDERRKVAARLREYASWDEDGELVGCTEFGEAVLNLLSCGDTERECFNALADLIDPDCRNESFCKVCGHVIPDGWSECPRCKTKVVSDD